jgi:Fe-S oxidoreductase
VEACPVTIEHVDKIVGLRRNLVLEESRFPAEVTAAFNNLERHGNPWGQPRSARLDWARGLPFEVAVAADGQPFEVLYWVGCAAAFDDRNRRVARAVATCLHAAGIRFAVLGEEESCSGDPARRMGNEYLYQVLAQANVETLDHYRPPLILTSCPHCYNTLANEYSQFGGHYQVVHHSVYLAQLIAEGRLRTLPAPGPRPQATGAPQLARTEPVPGMRPVTYHDSCYLARYNGVVEAPRAVLAAVPGLQLLEMEQHGKQSFCCGAGGGRMWMEERRGIRINAERTRQALETGADAVATACPFCLVMLRDGVADAAGGGDRGREVETLDIAELLAAALAPAPGAGISQEDATR